MLNSSCHGGCAVTRGTRGWSRHVKDGLLWVEAQILPGCCAVAWAPWDRELASSPVRQFANSSRPSGKRAGLVPGVCVHSHRSPPSREHSAVSTGTPRLWSGKRMLPQTFEKLGMPWVSPGYNTVNLQYRYTQAANDATILGVSASYQHDRDELPHGRLCCGERLAGAVPSKVSRGPDRGGIGWREV